jgi:cytochrome c oxidase cbb3-type subunit 3
MMRTPAFLLWWVPALALVGCNESLAAPPQAGAPPPVGTPVGPVPGPGVEREGPANPFGDDPVARAQGRTLFSQYNCAGCHGDHGGGGMGPSLRDATWIYGSTDAHLFSSIAEGRGHGMPSWGTKISQDQIWKLVSYVKTLRSPDEVDPPDQTLPREPQK